MSGVAPGNPGVKQSRCWIENLLSPLFVCFLLVNTSDDGGCSLEWYARKDWHASVDKSEVLEKYAGFHPGILAVIK